MISVAERMKLWDQFLTVWPAERIASMELSEYSNLARDDAFIFWVEGRLVDLGSIWGGSAFKFGIYRRNDTEPKAPRGGRIWGEQYAWLAKYGKTEEEAFATIRDRVASVVESVQGGNLDRIDEIDLAHVFKWKVAFLYQDRNAPTVLSIFKKEGLFHHYHQIDPAAKRSSTPYSVMHAALLARHKHLGGLFDISGRLWAEYQESQERGTKAWAVPLLAAFKPEDIPEFCSRKQVQAEDIPQELAALLAAADLAEGDLLALLQGGDARALGTLTNADDGGYEWSQIRVDIPSELVPPPTDEVRELDAGEREGIWGQAPDTDPPGVRYWKIAPGPNAVAWKEWKQHGIASIGWSHLGDLSGMSRDAFDAQAAKCEQQHPDYKKQGMSQVWSFRGIRPGDRVVANQGKHTALGVGTVLEGYRYSPGWHEVQGEDYCHQIKVRWDETEPRSVKQPGWQRTLIRLTDAEFKAIIATPTGEAPAPPAQVTPGRPQNIILYGPPGTGKTYSTVRRSLELVLGEKAVSDLPDDALIKIFRKKQADGEIEFVTFHQAYGYEEFVEGIRPVFGEADGGDVRYELHSGAFKRIALRAAVEGLQEKAEAATFEDLWATLVRAVAEQEDRVVTSASGKTYILRASSVGNLRAYGCTLDPEGNLETVSDTWQTASKELTRLIWANRETLGPDPKEVTSTKTKDLFAREVGGLGGHHYTALWIAYRELFSLSQSATARRGALADPIARVQQALDKTSAGAASFTFTGATPQFVLIIDEINRGNVSKILGELITLLEPDKRLGSANELKLPLSYSPAHRFAVPPNLHVIGTMNTADRSIALMDVALRRRFTFEELMPDAGVIREVLTKKAVDPRLIELTVDTFEALNERIRFLYDRDHQLGHSYFLDVRSLADLQAVFLDRVLPMLQEYFYGAWDKICMVLGCPYDEDGKPQRGKPTAPVSRYKAPIVRAIPFPEKDTIGFDHGDYEDRLDFQVDDGFSTAGEEGLLPYVLGVLPDARYEHHAQAYQTAEAVGPIGAENTA